MAVKEHIVNLIHKTLKNGDDVANYIETEDLDQYYGYKPVRQLADFNDKHGKPRKQMDVTIKQEGLNIDYKEELLEYNDRKKTFENNCIKVGALIFSYCNKTMQNHLSEISDLI